MKTIVYYALTCLTAFTLWMADWIIGLLVLQLITGTVQVMHSLYLTAHWWTLPEAHRRLFRIYWMLAFLYLLAGFVLIGYEAPLVTNGFFIIGLPWILAVGFTLMIAWMQITQRKKRTGFLPNLEY